MKRRVTKPGQPSQVSLLASGYERVWYNGKYQRLHRVIMEEWLIKHNPKSNLLSKGKLRKEVLIHHINSIKTDNRIENLECISPKEHSHIHLDKYPNMSYKEKQVMWHSDSCPICKGRKQIYSKRCKSCYHGRKTK